MSDFERDFALTKTDVGWIAGAAFWGFGLSILLGGPLCDLLGMGTLLRLAAAGHIAGTIATIAAPNFLILFAATLVIGIANGLVEAAINPLIATIYADDKTHRLVALHAWFPGGIVIGGVLSFLLSQAGAPAAGVLWQWKMLLILVPAVIYTLMFAGQHFPPTERAAAGVPFGEMFKEMLRPLFIVVWLCMWMTAATELGPGQWMSNIFNDVMKSSAQAGILVLVWVNGIMYLIRQFLAGAAHRISPVALIAATAVAAASGITSERFPRGGALLLAVIGATGSISSAISGPVMGWINERYGADRVLSIWAALPAVLIVIFTGIYLRDRVSGGYRIERISSKAGAAI